MHRTGIGVMHSEAPRRPHNRLTDTYEFAPLRVPNSADAAYEAADWGTSSQNASTSVGIEETVGTPYP